MDPMKYVPSSAWDSDFWTTNNGMPVYSNTQSLTAGARGPVLLEDYHLVEKLAQFDRERIPERVVHARGASAKGYFEVTHDVTHLTCADLFRAVGVQTPVATRFSTVVHPKGSPETLRDPRGFAVKFYTREGNWDLVGNNMPVFFVRDSIQFPDMVHAFKPNPKTNVQESWRFMDFFSTKPESCHMLAFLFDDVGIPLNYRHMEGFGVHTYTWINKAGKETYVKYHWKPSVGVKSLLDDEAVTVGGKNQTHATQDLYDHIAAGGSAVWTLYIQTMDPADEDKYDFDPLDVTKIWPENDFPLKQVGKMVLNKNPDNFFAENEMLAFCPGVTVPGITYSDDKLLQGRIFSYSDTQRHRLGPNYLLIPINAPKCKYHNNHHEGFMNITQRNEEVNYFPSKYINASNAAKYPTTRRLAHGNRVKATIPKENNFQQPGERFRSWDPARQQRFVDRMTENLACPKVTQEIRRIWIGYWSACDAQLGAAIAKNLNMKPAM